MVNYVYVHENANNEHRKHFNSSFSELMKVSMFILYK